MEEDDWLWADGIALDQLPTQLPTIPADDLAEAGELVAIERARLLILEGVDSIVAGRLKIVKGLLYLRQDDRWRRDPLVAHIKNPRWKDYLGILIQWMRERNPDIQLGLSTLLNYIKYYQAFCQGLGLDEELVFGATENTRRQVYRMCAWDYGGGPPKYMRGDYDLRRLPLPSRFTGSEPPELRLAEGMKEVAKQAFSQSHYKPDLLAAYKKRDDDGDEPKITVKMELHLNDQGIVTEWIAHVARADAKGNPIASFSSDLLAAEMPYEVLDWLEARGFQVEMDA